MRTYFFHTEDGRRVEDDIGTPLPSDDAARLEAVRVLGELLREKPELFWEHKRFELTVTDEDGKTFLVLHLGAGEIKPSPQAPALQG